MTEYTPDQLTEIAHTLVYDGFLQEHDLDNQERILNRMRIREKVKQKTVRDLRERAGE